MQHKYSYEEIVDQIEKALEYSYEIESDWGYRSKLQQIKDIINLRHEVTNH